ncbi:MAG: transketolase [Spirochaetes bacterium]|nr:transketolase [Spirochaetota bacterium]
MDFIEEKSALLAIKECDLRADCLFQCGSSIDKGIHIGGAYSEIPSLTALYYGGFMDYDVHNPTSPDHDIFVLSKGHAIAALASVYADVGYFERKHLQGSRGYGALIKGHPGPIIPGVPIATGPLGHGISLAAGYALKRKENKSRKVFCLVGDGELQEGSCWEGIMFAGDRGLGNLCVIVDKNDGQSDNTSSLLIRMDNISERFQSFGFRVLKASGDDIGSILCALESFSQVPQGSKPTAIICQSNKVIGGFAAFVTKHKATIEKGDLERETKLLLQARDVRIKNLNHFQTSTIERLAEGFGYRCVLFNGAINDLIRIPSKVSVSHPDRREKSLEYDASCLPVLEEGKEYAASDIIKKAMSAFAQDPRLYTIDADLSNASGLYEGTQVTNRLHAVNAGIAECGMMCMAEALASEGANVWVSTFGPFFDWQAFRRIAVGYQERAEVIETGKGWLSEGYNTDITFVATAANLDTAVNGATHMSNDDICFFNQLAHLKMIDISCPRQLLSVLEWIAGGDKGLVYLRVMRNKSKVLYGPDFRFEFGKGYYLKKSTHSKAVIISSGHGVLEALAAADMLAKNDDIEVDVLDMPSYDYCLFESLAQEKLPLVFAEQNNGALLNKFAQHMFQERIPCDQRRILHLSALTPENQLQFIQSGTYQELIGALSLRPEDIAAAIKAF